MALTAGVAKYRYNKDLFNALMRGEKGKVIQLCRENPEGPLHVLTLHQDTVLHVATYSKQKDLVHSLLQELPEGQFAKLTHQNDGGNTVLHEAVTSDRTVNVAMDLLLKAPKLLSMRNHHGETALFRAARYGKSKMYEFLDDEMNKSIKDPAELKAFHYRDDKTTILHLSILNEHFGLALLIASKYEYLLNEKDDDGMTALQLLACNPAAFEDRRSTPVSLKRFFYSSQRCCTMPFWESIQKQHRIYEEAVKIAKFLIERDTSWEETESALDPIKPKIHKYSAKNSQYQGVGKGKKAATSTDQTVHQKFAETPLLLATKAGIMEIVEEILTTYPQAVDHVDHNGQNILHRAIKYRQMQVFDFVEKMEIPMRRLTRKIDNNGNSILHYVGKRSHDREAEDMRSPALILQENLLLFERVEKICQRYSVKHFNSKGQTAAELFREANAKLRTDAKEWLKRTAENCSIVAVLIATVAFAAAYTIPGGPNQTTGYPLLLNQPFFVIFTIADVLSLTIALTSVIVFLSILTSSFQLMDFKQSLPQKLMLGVTLLICSVSFMMVAFAATVLLMIHNNENWTKVALYLVALLPVCIFALSYLPLYVSLIKTSIFSLKKIGEALPRCNCVFPRSSTTTQASIPSNPSQSQGSSSTSHYLEIE